MNENTTPVAQNQTTPCACTAASSPAAPATAQPQNTAAQAGATPKAKKNLRKRAA